MEKDLGQLLVEYFAERVSPYEADPKVVYCSKDKNPDLEKIMTYCQKTKCMRLRTLQDKTDKGAD